MCGGFYGWMEVSAEEYRDLCGVDPPTDRTPPPADDDSVADSAGAAASWASAPAPTGEGTPPEGHTPFEPGAVRTASAAEPTASDAAADAAGTPTGDAERAADDEGTDR